MLLQMRTFTRSVFAYLLLFILVIAFAIWGINDVFRNVGGQKIATVGRHDVTPAQASREMELILRQQRNQGRNVSQQDAIEAGVHTRIIESLIARAALADYTDQIQVGASDAQVAARIRDIPNAMNPVSGQFDPDSYAAFLRELRYTRPEFENDIRGDLTANMVIQSLSAGVRPPSSFGKIALAFESETRTISVAQGPAALIGTVAPPTPEQLNQFYQDNADNLRLPEFRALTLVLAKPTDFAARVNVPEQSLREEFARRSAALTQPEKRSYVRITAQNEAQARDAATRLGRGEAPDAVAAALGLQSARGEDQAKTQITDTGVADAVFGTPAGSTRVARGQLAPFVAIRVDHITPPVSPTFESQRDAIRQELAADEANDLLSAAVQQFEDARAGGATIADAGRQAGLTVLTVPAVTKDGRAQNGQPVPQLEGFQEILNTAFDTREGEASDFTPGPDNADVVVSVDRIIPASVRPLDQVRGDLTTAWMARERARRMNELGEQIVAAVAGGQSFADAVRTHHFQMVVSSRPINRQQAQQALPAQRIGGAIFGAREGAVVSDMRVDQGAVVVAVVEHINRIDPSTQPQLVEQARVQANESMQQSLVEALQSAIIARAHPRRNEAVINQVFPNGNAATEDEDAAAKQ